MTGIENHSLSGAWLFLAKRLPDAIQGGDSEAVPERIESRAAVNALELGVILTQVLSERISALPTKRSSLRALMFPKRHDLLLLAIL